MRSQNYRNTANKGFTLVEIMIATAIMATVMLGVMAIFIHLDKTWVSEELKADMQQTARVGMDNMVRDMMMMGYGASGGNQVGGHDGKILVAGKDEIEFVSFINDPTSASATVTDRKEYRINYYLTGTPGQLRKKYRVLADPPGTVVEDILLAENVKALEFQYYYLNANNVMKSYSSIGEDPDNPKSTPTNDEFDECYSGDPPVWTTSDECDYYQSQRDLIRRVKIMLQIETDKVVPGTGGKKVITLRADISPRNLWETDVAGDVTPLVPVSAPTVDEDGNPISPEDVNGFGPELIKVRDTGECGRLAVKWVSSYDPNSATADSRNRDIAGYIVQYGVVEGFWTGTKDVPHVPEFTNANPPHTTLDDCTIQYFTDAQNAAAYHVWVTPYDIYMNMTSTTTLKMMPHDPLSNITSFAGLDDDTAVNIPMPAAFSNFSAFTNVTSTDAQVTLKWTPSTDPNVVGYRIYRSEEPFSTYPIPDTFQISKETEFGDTWIGPRTDAGGTHNGATWEYTDGTFVDRSNGIIGCTDYYYAVCQVTCDATLIYGPDTLSRVDALGDPAGVYTVSQYAFADVTPEETTPPENPVITARAGYKRVFLNILWPGDVDYDYTRIFFKSGTANVTERPEPIDASAIPDHQTAGGFSGYTTTTAGVFHDYGTAALYTVIFNNEVTDQGDGDYPQLLDNQSYTFLAVAYDKCGNSSDEVAYAVTFAEICGDDPCGPPTWTDGIGSASVWINATDSNLDTSTWGIASELRINLEWTGIDVTDEDTGLDFYGYKLSRDTIPMASAKGNAGMTQVITGQWTNNSFDQSLEEGNTYYYCLQATDCIYEVVNSTGGLGIPDIVCVDTGDTSTPQEIQANNITDCVKLDEMKPGRLKLYNEPGITNGVTRGEYHNKVLFYLQNTSASPLQIDSITAGWDNPDLKLESVTFGLTTDDPELTIPLAAGSKIPTSISRMINTKAVSPGLYSGPIPVTLNFANAADGSVNQFTNMRGQLITVEFEFTNPSMPADEAHATSVSGFTTGDIDGTSPIAIAVTGGPVINLALQDQPTVGYNPFTVSDRANDATLPVGYPEVPGKREVNMLVNVTRPSTETVGSVDPVVIRYATTSIADYTPPTDDNLSSLDYTSIAMTSLGGSYYTGTIPGPAGTDGRGVWYYILAETDQGNFARRPTAFDAFFYYQQLEFNKCNETPSAPGNLMVDADIDPDGPFLTWSSVTTYSGGYDIPAGEDPLMYGVYRADGIGQGITFTLMTTVGVGVLEYTDWEDPAIAVTYAVTAVNSCTVPGPNESELSDAVSMCPGGTVECDVWISDSVIFTGQTTLMTLATCSAAANGISDAGVATVINFRELQAQGGLVNWGYGVVNVVESGDTGVTEVVAIVATDDATYAGTSTSDGIVFATDPSNGVMVDYLSIGSYFKEFGCDTSIITVIVDPCNNTPNAPSGLTGALSSVGSNYFVELVWPEVSSNTDGSPAVYYTEYARYQVWHNSSEAGVADTLLGTVDPVAGSMAENPVVVTGSSVSVAADGTVTCRFQLVSAPPNNKKYNYYLKAVDTCSPLQNESTQSNVIVLER